MDSRTYYKTTVRVEILTDEPFEWDTLDDLHYIVTHGHGSGWYPQEDCVEITEQELVRQCGKHGTDYTFFTEVL